jgi:protein-S-isoprenylcysteine O-methyltransferase Ste14
LTKWAVIARRIRVPLGFAFAALYLWLAKPSATSICAGSVLIIVGLGIRGMASGHVRKNEQLTTSGPYAHTRHPLYLGSLVMAAGFSLAGRSWWIAVITALIFLMIYVPVMLAEETFLRQRFPEFEDYARAVPRLWPRLKSFTSGQGSFSWKLYYQHREYNALVGSVALLAVLAVKLLWNFN